MKEIKRIDDNTVEIDGVRYYSEAEPDKAETVKPEWPTDTAALYSKAYDYDTRTMKINPHDWRKYDCIGTCLDAARAINGDWEPDWEGESQRKYCPVLTLSSDQFLTDTTTNYYAKSKSLVWFHSQEACDHFLDHFGEIWLEAIG